MKNIKKYKTHSHFLFSKSLHSSKEDKIHRKIKTMQCETSCKIVVNRKLDKSSFLGS